MSLLLSPRLWLALLLAAALGFTHFTAYRAGKNHVQAEWTAATAAANIEANRLEQRRQDRANESAKLAAAREARLRADAAGARGQLDGLRDDLRTANEHAKESRAAAERLAGLASELLGECSRALVGLAEAADRADSEARQLRQAWPE